jgi:hypothetical protein
MIGCGNEPRFVERGAHISNQLAINSTQIVARRLPFAARISGQIGCLPSAD